MLIKWNNKSLFGFSVLIFLNIQYLGVISSEPQCYSVHEKNGKCVTFDMCPPLNLLLKSGTLTVDKLRLLQRLTCGFNKDEPKICCPVTEIVTEGNWEIPGFQTNSQDKLKPDHSHLQTKMPHVPEVSTINRVHGIIEDYKAHPNFALIPGIKDCSNPVNSDRIIGGKEAALGSYPWMVRIGYKNEQTQEIEFYCGGTVINKRYILTAAHCTEEIDDGFTPTTIRVGEHDASTEQDCSPYLGCAKYKDYKIEKLIPHSDYSTEDKNNDIELIRVTEDISFTSFSVRPVCLPFHKEYEISNLWQRIFTNENKHKGWVMGWGRTKWNKAEGSNILQEVQLPLITNEECQFNYNNKIQLSEKQMCAGGILLKDSCGGDSGGPLLVPIPVKGEGKFFQLGVVSFGPVQCGLAGLPGVYSRVSAYLSWILDNIQP